MCFTMQEVVLIAHHLTAVALGAPIYCFLSSTSKIKGNYSSGKLPYQRASLGGLQINLSKAQRRLSPVKT